MSAMALNLLSAMSVPSDEPRPALRKGDGGMTEQRFDWYLWVYEQWFFGEGMFVGSGGGRSTTSTIMRSTSSQEFDAMYIAVCRRCAEATDALVDGLKPPERAAFQVKHCDLPIDVARVALHLRGDRLGDDPLEERYTRARNQLRVGLKARGFE